MMDIGDVVEFIINLVDMIFGIKLTGRRRK